MAESNRAVRGKARQKAERTGLRQKICCFVWGHDHDLWELEVTQRFDPPVVLAGEVVSELGPVPSEEKWCRRCGKILR